MSQQLDHDSLEEALRRCAANWSAAQSHGLLSGRLAVAGQACGPEWLALVLDGVAENDASRLECAKLLSACFELSYRQLSERLSEFAPLLPDDDAAEDIRATALAHWCEGFLHGLVSAQHGDELKQRLAADPMADIIKDMLHITRASADADEDPEAFEEAWIELVEYVRVAAQLAYEELADLRDPADKDASDPKPETLH
jgi:yecA family protein